MEVSDKLKEDIKAAVILAVEAYGNDHDLVPALVEGVIEVLSEVEKPRSPATVGSLIAVKYVGKREMYSDGLFDTGDWRKGETRLVPKGVASQMFAHAAVYVPGGEENALSSVEESGEVDEGDYAPNLQAARDLVMQMTKKDQVVEYVENTFNGMKVDLPKSAKLDEFKQFAIAQIDLQRLP